LLPSVTMMGNILSISGSSENYLACDEIDTDAKTSNHTHGTNIHNRVLMYGLETYIQ